MNSNKTNPSKNFDQQAAAFIAGIQRAAIDPVDEQQIDIETFTNSSPAQVKRLLDYYEAKHGALEHWTFQDIVETLSAERKKQGKEVGKQHAVHHFNLCRAYAAGHAINEVETSYYTYYDNEEIELGDALEDEPITLCHKVGDVTLNVYPQNDDAFQAFGIVDASGPVFHSPLAKVVTYLELPAGIGGHEFEVCLDAPIYWFCGTELVAAGYIGQVLHQDLIVTPTHMILPVIAVPDWKWPKTAEVMDRLPSEDQDKLIAFLEYAEKTNSQDDDQLSLLPASDDARSLPKIAIEMDSGLGLEISSDIGYTYSMNQSAARNVIAKQRRKNL